MLLGFCPFYRLHVGAATALAGALADRITFALGPTCTGIFPLSREYLLFAVCHYRGLAFFNLRDFGLNQILAARAFARGF